MRPVRRAPGWAVVGWVATVVAVVLASAATAVATIAPVRSSSAPISWHRCGDGFRCGTLAVPLSAEAPDRTIDLAVIRKAARTRAERIGTLMVNPGGPGAPAVNFLRNVADTLPDPLRDRFDLVAFDPRGVGASSPVQCADSLDPVFDQSFEPADDAQRAALVDAMRALAQQCAARNGDLLAHLGTADAVRDMEQLRVALGVDKLSFLGYSYGTFLGASYADAHPARVRAFVLDGPVDPSMTARQVTLSQARGFERALDDFLADCSANTGCAFHHDGDAASAYDELRARAANAPLPTDDGGRTLDLTRFDAGVLEQLYFGRSAWPALAESLAGAGNGDASTLLAEADTFTGRRPDGSDDHALDAFWAVTCLDGPVIGGVDAARVLERDAIADAPRMGAFIVNNSLPCSVWPVAPEPAPARQVAAGSPPILVIGTTRDPATPLAQARGLADTLARGRLLVADGEQHTSFNNGNDCVDQAVTRFFTELVPPPRGTRC
jgi:pimeloyl-ACP methyl ester carboxylesterase